MARKTSAWMGSLICAFDLNYGLLLASISYKWRESHSYVHLSLFWCVISKKIFVNFLCPLFLPFTFSPSPLGIFSLLPWLGRDKEIGDMNCLHWNSFSTQNDFLVFILWYGDSWYAITAPWRLFKDWFSPLLLKYQASSPSTNHWC